MPSETPAIVPPETTSDASEGGAEPTPTTGASGGNAGGGTGGDTNALAGAPQGGLGGSGTAGTPAFGGSGGLTAEGGAGGEPGGNPCADRTGGAVVVLKIVGEMFTTWLTNDEFITELEGYLGRTVGRIPLMTLVDGADCDSQWSWHIHPQDASFEDDWVDICDAWPSYVEDNKSFYLTNEDYCPRDVTVISVTHQ